MTLYEICSELEKYLNDLGYSYMYSKSTYKVFRNNSDTDYPTRVSLFRHQGGKISDNLYEKSSVSVEVSLHKKSNPNYCINSNCKIYYISEDNDNIVEEFKRFIKDSKKYLIDYYT